MSRGWLRWGWGEILDYFSCRRIGSRVYFRNDTCPCFQIRCSINLGRPWEGNATVFVFNVAFMFSYNFCSFHWLFDPLLWFGSSLQGLQEGILISTKTLPELLFKHYSDGLSDASHNPAMRPRSDFLGNLDASGRVVLILRPDHFLWEHIVVELFQIFGGHVVVNLFVPFGLDNIASARRAIELVITSAPIKSI